MHVGLPRRDSAAGAATGPGKHPKDEEYGMTDKFPGFELVRRGYDRDEVDRFLCGEDGGPLGETPRFTIARRGYDRDQVEAFIRDLHTRVGRNDPGVANPDIEA